MTDQPSAVVPSVEKPVEKPAEIITVTFSLPDWNLDHWETYTEGSLAYRETRIARKLHTNQSMSDFHGALALIDAGIVHVKGLPSGILPVNPTTPGWVLGLFLTEISQKIELAMNTKPDFLVVSSGI